jgi:uncharacterized OsmC-like protein
MVELKVKMRPLSATAIVKRFGHPQVKSDTGGELEIVTGAAEPGFNPLDLMFSSLAGCLVLSGRIAASRLGMLDRLTEVRAHVTGEKAPEGPSRIVRFVISLVIDGDLADHEKAQIAHMAEEICTVSNTLKTLPTFSVNAV